MIKAKFTGLIILLAAVLTMVSCSGGKSPVVPGNPEIPGISDTLVAPEPDIKSDRDILAVYDAVIDPDSGTFEVAPAERTAEYHFPLSQLYPNVLKIVGYGFTPNFWADIKLTHPFPGSGIDAYDPRIIAIVPYTASNNFYFPGFNAVGNGKIVMEPDGYTKLHDSLGGTIAGNINPFKAYMKNQPNRVWSSTGTTSETQRWNLNLAGFGGTVRYKFVVDVSTSYPDPSLPGLSNAPEPVQITAMIGKGLTPEGGDTFIDVELLDWQEQSGIGPVVFECPSLFTGIKTLTFEEGTENQFYYHGVFANTKSVAAGNYDLMVKTSDTASGVEMYNLFKATVSDHTPSNPLEITSNAIELTPGRIFQDGEFLYITAGDHGLHIYNVSDPRYPVWVNWINTFWTNDIYVEHGLAYVASDDGFRILDVSSPEDVHEIKYIETHGNAFGVTVREGYAFVADGYEGLEIIDVDPVEDAHIIKEVLPTSGDSEKVAVFEGYAYLANGLSLDIVDVSPIESASVVHSISMPAHDVLINGVFAYVAADYLGMQIVNISDPRAAFIEGTIDTPGTARSLSIDREFVYLADEDSGVQVIQLKSPVSGEIIKNVSCDANHVCLNSPYGYVADYGTGIRVISIDVPEEARIRANVFGLKHPFDVEVSGNYLYAAVGIDGLQIIDNTPLNTWHVVKTVPTSLDAKRMDVENGYACVVDYTSGLQIIDVEPYSTASVVKTIPASAGWIPNDVVISNGYAYVANYGLSIVDIDPPSTASIVKSVYTATESYGVCIDNDGYAYVADYGGLQIIDIEPIESAHVVKFVDTPGLPYAVRAENGYAYIANFEDGMQIIDVYPPESAHIVNTVATTEGQSTIDLSGGYAYVSEHGAGFQIIDVEPAETAYVVKSIDTPNNCVNVNVFNGFAYSSDWNDIWYYNRLQVFQLW